ncbi:hypothetical protein ABQ358_28875, partial [Serratia fonticola]
VQARGESGMSKIKITLEDAKAELRDAATGPRSQYWSYAPAVMALLNSHDELLAILGEATAALEEKDQKIETMKVQAEGANECTKLIFEAKNYWVARARAAEQLLQQPALADVIAERQRQISAEGWTPDHDDKHDFGEIAAFAVLYAMPTYMRKIFVRGGGTLGEIFLPAGWKPKFSNRRKNLVKAGALILAEIERLDRAAAKVEGSDKPVTELR